MKTSTILITIALVGSATLGYLLINKDADAKNIGSGGNLKAGSGSEFTDPLMQKGSRHSSVKQVQQAIITKGGLAAQHIIKTGGADGIYGNGTAAALKALGVGPTWKVSETQAIIQSIKAGSLKGITIYLN